MPYSPTVFTAPHSSPDTRSMPSTTENTFFGSLFAPRIEVGVFMLSDVGCMLTQVVQPARSLPLKSDCHGPSAASTGPAKAMAAVSRPRRAVRKKEGIVVSLWW